MKVIIAHIVALALALFNGKLVAGAISGILLTPLAKPFERFGWVSRYMVLFLQGVAMGFVAVCTAEWVFLQFGLKMGWAIIAMIIFGYVLISCHLMKRIEERHFHISAGVGELLGIFVGSYLFSGTDINRTALSSTSLPYPYSLLPTPYSLLPTPYCLPCR